MTRDARCISKKLTIRDVAKKMCEYNISVIPVGEDNHVEGVITNGCILRSIAKGKDPSRTTAEEAMIKRPHLLQENETLENACRTLCELRTRGLPVVTGQNKLVGFISIDDFAHKSGEQRHCLDILRSTATVVEHV